MALMPHAPGAVSFLGRAHVSELSLLGVALLVVSLLLCLALLMIWERFLGARHASRAALQALKQFLVKSCACVGAFLQHAFDGICRSLSPKRWSCAYWGFLPCFCGAGGEMPHAKR